MQSVSSIRTKIKREKSTTKMADKETILYILMESIKNPKDWSWEHVAERIAALDEGPCDCCRERGCGNGCMCKDDCTCEAIYTAPRPPWVPEEYWEDMVRCEGDRGHKFSHFIIIPPMDWDAESGMYSGGERIRWGE